MAALTIVAFALLACKSQSEKQKDYAAALSSGLPKGCKAFVVSAGPELRIDCVGFASDDIRSTAEDIAVKVYEACGELQSLDFDAVDLKFAASEDWYRTNVRGTQCDLRLQ